MNAVGAERAAAVIRPARAEEATAIAGIVNRAYVVEREFITGERTDAGEVAAAMASDQFLVAEGPERQLLGCVYVRAGGDEGYFGMLSVEPEAQGLGLGYGLVQAAEAHLREQGCTYVEILVVSGREPLLPWYGALGYEPAGTHPFPDEDRLIVPVHFVVMRKALHSAGVVP
jgi:GNAT superfamily N-acetyltransferase